MKKLNILHTETLKGWGGQQNKVLKEMKISRELGHHCILLCNPDSEISRRSKNEGFKVIEFPMNKKNFHKSIPFCLKLIKLHHIDIIVSHGSTDSWITAIAGNISSKKPYLMRERHNLFPVKGYISKLLHRKLFDRILVLGESVKKYMTSIGVSYEKCFLLPSTVNVSHFDNTVPTLRKEYKIPKNSIVLGVLTSLTKSKGVFEFFEVAKILIKRYPTLYIVFGGRYSQNVKKDIDKYFDDYPEERKRIIWTGFVQDAATVMKDFDIFLFPTHTEGLGTVILEAMAAKNPVIVYDKEPMNILVQNGINGLTCPFLNHDCLAENTANLIDDHQLRKKMSENAYNFICENYSDKILYNQIKNLLESVNV